jgi:hypothetical protein
MNHEYPLDNGRVLMSSRVGLSLTLRNHELSTSLVAPLLARQSFP